MKIPTTFTAQNAPALLCIAQRRRSSDGFQATLLAWSANWNGATLNYYLSPDGGTTLIVLKDLSGNAITSTGNDNVNINLGNSSHNDDRLQVWGKLTGATATVNVAVYDNN